MDTDSFIILIHSKDVYENIVDDVEKRFDTENCVIERPLPSNKNKKVIGLMKDELDWKEYDRICRTYTKNIFLLNRWRSP